MPKNSDVPPELQAKVDAANKAIVESVKDEAAERVVVDDGPGGRPISIVKHRGAVPPPMQPKAGDRAISLQAASRLSESLREEREKRNRGNKRDWKNSVSYVECIECQGPGIWILGDPELELHENNWYSSYKPLGAFWGPERQPHCQVCEASQGRRMRLRINFISIGIPGNQQNVGLIANPRFLRTLTVEEYQDLLQPAS